MPVDLFIIYLFNIDDHGSPIPWADLNTPSICYKITRDNWERIKAADIKINLEGTTVFCETLIHYRKLRLFVLFV